MLTLSVEVQILLALALEPHCFPKGADVINSTEVMVQVSELGGRGWGGVALRTAVTTTCKLLETVT